MTVSNPSGSVQDCTRRDIHRGHEWQAEFGAYYNVWCRGNDGRGGPNEGAEGPTFGTRVWTNGGAHVTISVYVGRAPGSRALAGTLTMRQEEAKAFLALLSPNGEDLD